MTIQKLSGFIGTCILSLFRSWYPGWNCKKYRIANPTWAPYRPTFSRFTSYLCNYVILIHYVTYVTLSRRCICRWWGCWPLCSSSLSSVGCRTSPISSSAHTSWAEARRFRYSWATTKKTSSLWQQHCWHISTVVWILISMLSYQGEWILIFILLLKVWMRCECESVNELL